MENTVAVCIMTFNRRDLLKKTIDSVFNSSYKDFQVIVFNDCSTDGTNEYLDSLKNIKVSEIRHPANLGHVNNANYLIEYVTHKSSYDYFLVLHDDDTIHPLLLEKKINLMRKDKDISIIGSGWNHINENDEIIKTISYYKFREDTILGYKEYFLNFFKGMNFPWTGIMYRKNKVGNINFNDYYGDAADVVFVSELALNNKVGYIPEAIYNYRIHGGQNTVNRDDQYIDYEMWVLIFKYYQDLIKSYFNEKDYRLSLKKAINETLFASILKSPDFKFFFRLLGSKYFTLHYLSPVRHLKILNKFFKLMRGKYFKKNHK